MRVDSLPDEADKKSGSGAWSEGGENPHRRVSGSGDDGGGENRPGGVSPGRSLWVTKSPRHGSGGSTMSTVF